MTKPIVDGRQPSKPSLVSRRLNKAPEARSRAARRSQVVLGDVDNPGGKRVLPWWYLRRVRRRQAVLQATEAAPGAAKSRDARSPATKAVSAHAGQPAVVQPPVKGVCGAKRHTPSRKKKRALRDRKLRREARKLTGLVDKMVSAKTECFNKTLEALTAVLANLASLLPSQLGVKKEKGGLGHFIRGEVLDAPRPAAKPAAEASLKASPSSSMGDENKRFVEICRTRAALADRAKYIRAMSAAKRQVSYTLCGTCNSRTCGGCAYRAGGVIPPRVPVTAEEINSDRLLAVAIDLRMEEKEALGYEVAKLLGMELHYASAQMKIAAVESGSGASVAVDATPSAAPVAAKPAPPSSMAGSYATNASRTRALARKPR